VPSDEDFLVAVEEALEKQLLPTPGFAVLERTRDAVVGALVPLVARLRAASVVVPAADRATLRDRIAEALADATGARWPAQAFLTEADAVVSVLPAPADRAAALEEAADRLEAMMTEAYERARSENEIGYGNGLENATRELRRLAVESAVVDRVAAETPATSGRCPHGCDVSTCPCLACEADQLDTGEAQQPERCVHCGKPVRRITGTLAVWWVHDPGGHTACHPQYAAASTRAEPGPAVPAQPGNDTETPPIPDGRCPACGHTVCDGDGPCGARSGSDFCTCPGLS
jgi:hypothetical protein